ncbi:hypothetical protein EfmAA290_30100 (plasmid) [Enterococcus faecium]|nr:hypothetical protein EfmAA290_30100 [Enterococcus faecium]
MINIKIFTIFFVIDIEELELSYKAFSISLLDFIIVKQEYKQERTIVNMIKIIKVLFFFLVIYAIAFFITFLI